MVTAELKNYRQSPRKVRLVVAAIQGKNIANALTALTFMSKRAAEPVQKLLESAIANAQHNFNLNKDTLFVKEATVNSGPILKRSMPSKRTRFPYP